MIIVHLPKPLPTADALVELAITETDFIGDLDADTLVANAENSADLAAELWEEARGFPVNATVPLAIIVAARHALLERGWQILCQRETDAAAELADARDAGWGGAA
jgi:hypothetical protein